jgi:hypothetical protein
MAVREPLVGQRHCIIRSISASSICMAIDLAFRDYFFGIRRSSFDFGLVLLTYIAIQDVDGTTSSERFHAYMGINYVYLTSHSDNYMYIKDLSILPIQNAL